MLSVAVALVMGVLLFPIVLVFSPIYFPWTLLALAAAGALVGLTVGSHGRAWLARVGGLAGLTVLAVLVIFRVSGNFVGPLVALFSWLAWLLVPIFPGALAGAVARRRFGAVRGAGTVLAGTLGLVLLGTVLAVALAPRDVADIPYCEGSPSCPRQVCWMTAERRRLFTIETITAYDDRRMECTYTGWGGVRIGVVTWAKGEGSGWTDGDWPVLLSGRGR